MLNLILGILTKTKNWIETIEDYQLVVALDLKTSKNTAKAHYNLALAMKSNNMSAEGIEDHLVKALDMGYDLTVSASHLKR